MRTGAAAVRSRGDAIIRAAAGVDVRASVPAVAASASVRKAVAKYTARRFVMSDSYE
jgi:hypothetical protein